MCAEAALAPQSRLSVLALKLSPSYGSSTAGTTEAAAAAGQCSVPSNNLESTLLEAAS